MTEPTLKTWKRRALKAEEEAESLRKLRHFDKAHEIAAHRQLATYKVALGEVRAALEWVDSEEPIR
jgi:hypothetical protein